LMVYIKINQLFFCFLPLLWYSQFLRTASWLIILLYPQEQWERSLMWLQLVSIQSRLVLFIRYADIHKCVYIHVCHILWNIYIHNLCLYACVCVSCVYLDCVSYSVKFASASVCIHVQHLALCKNFPSCCVDGDVHYLLFSGHGAWAGVSGHKEINNHASGNLCYFLASHEFNETILRVNIRTGNYFSLIVWTVYCELTFACHRHGQ
jgi:hypothetical protein